MTVWSDISIDDPTDDQLPIVYNGPAITLSKYTADASGSYVVPTNVSNTVIKHIKFRYVFMMYFGPINCRFFNL